MPDDGKTQLPPIEKEQDAVPVPSMRVAIVASLAAAILAMLLFSWLADEVFEGDTRRFDSVVRETVHQVASPALTRVMVGVSMLGSELLAVVFAVALAIFLWKRWMRAALWLVLTMTGALVLNVVLKVSFHRLRPLPYFGVAPHSYSFPSGHALMSFCLYGVLAGLLSVRIKSVGLRVSVWIAAGVLVTAIGLSRIYLGVHYPSDVLAGYLTAGVWVSTLLVADRVRKHKRLRKQR